MSRPEWIKRETSASVTRARAIERRDMSAHTMTTKVSVASAARVVDGRRARRAVGSRSARVVARAGDSWGPCSCHGGAHLSAERKAELEAICAAIGQAGKGITACDEGPGTIGSRFENVGVVNTEENRRSYRQMLFETPGANEYLSAAILDPETLYQKSTTNGKLFPRC